ncbi:MAG: tRNA (mo5U34)-methyltransferase [Acidimicrobiaceae bacterium]|nr:tRNA (mo5U34)-methyltransferase [Acidimicrobiaceae bacterium]
MAVRKIKVKGFGVTVEVPERVAAPLRRAVRRYLPGRREAGDGAAPVGEPGAPLVKPTPPLHLVPRDAGLAVKFITDRPEVRAAQSGVSESPVVEDDDSAEGLARRVAAHPWYHTIELPMGVVTPGAYDHRPVLPIYGIPKNLEGKRVLDVASADGFWAFEFEKRGAEVTSIDIDDTSECDIPWAVRRLTTKEELADPLGEGFALAHRLLGSKVKRLSGTVYDLDPDRLGKFDLVHSGDLLVHLQNPPRALENIRAVTGSEALLVEVFDPTLSADRTGEPRLVRYLGGWEMSAWWLPGLDALVQMVIDAGFSDVEVVNIYNLPYRGDFTGPWRAVMRARP